MRTPLVLLISLFFSSFTYAGVCSNTGSARQCMVCNCFHESKSEPFEGQVAVAQAVLTRMQTKGFPKTACGVIFDKDQFTWTKTLTSKPLTPKHQVDSCKKAVDTALERGANGYVYFHPKKNKPQPFLSRKARCGTIGNHIFYAERASDCPGRNTAGAKPAQKNQPPVR